MSASRIITAVCAVVLAAVVTAFGEPKSVRRPVPVRSRAADSSDVMPFRAVEKMLANGLKVIVVPTGSPNIVSLQIPVQTGSRNEVEPGKSGFAHFFEHMMFRGTKACPPDRYNEIVTQGRSPERLIRPTITTSTRRRRDSRSRSSRRTRERP